MTYQWEGGTLGRVNYPKCLLTVTWDHMNELADLYLGLWSWGACSRSQLQDRKFSDNVDPQNLVAALQVSLFRFFQVSDCGQPHRQQHRGTTAIAVGPFSAVIQELTRLRIGIRSEPCFTKGARVFRHQLDVAPSSLVAGFYWNVSSTSSSLFFQSATAFCGSRA